jgi:hypothetical protein
MWSPNSHREPTPIDGTSIKPLEVLYEYDGPTIFSARIGLSVFLFNKFDETPEHEFFIASQVTREVLEALGAGRLSVRGALENDGYWIIQTSGPLKVVSAWYVDELNFPTRLLPTRHHGLFHTSNPVPDTLEQATSYFSVKFNGSGLRRQSISFRRLKTLINEVYEVANNYLIPAFGNVSKYSVTDFDMAPLKFASLLISIKRPLVLQDAIKRRKLNLDPADGILGQMQQQRDDLMDGMEVVVGEAGKRELSKSFAGDNVTWIAALNTISPSRNDDVDFVEVSSSNSQSSRLLVIDTDTAARIKSAHSEVTRSKVSLQGKVVEINATASTFVFRANNVRQTTCVVDSGKFGGMVAGGELFVGATVLVTGIFERRDRRDRLTAQTISFV